MELSRLNGNSTKNDTTINMKSLFDKLGCTPKNWSTYNGPILTSSASGLHESNPTLDPISSYVLSNNVSVPESIPDYKLVFHVTLRKNLDTDNSGTIYCSMTGVIELECD